MTTIRYRLLPIASRVPESALRWLDRHAPIDRDPDCFNWSFWTDASYHRWCRQYAKARGGRPHPMTLITITCTHTQEADVYSFYPTMFSETF